MAGFYDDNDDLRFYVERGIDWAPLVRWTEFDHRAQDAFTNPADAVAAYTDILRLVGDFAAQSVAPRWQELDAAHPHLRDGEVEQAKVVDEIFAELGAMGLHGLCLPRELGGMNAPVLLLQLNTELLSRADTSVSAHAGFHGGMALAALMYSVMEGTTEFTRSPPRVTHTRFAEMIEEIVGGRAWGSMDITEPDAGSDMARLRCRARLDAEGRWRVSGQKIFITSGHARWHFVVARTEEAGDPADPFAGLGGLSLFLVPAWDWAPDGSKRWNATFAGVETKLGHSASATVSITFEDARAELIGTRGEGFKLMLLLMNNARVGVGFESLGVAEAAYRRARAYAAERRSMGKTIDRHEMIADLLDEMATDLQVVRALAVTAAVEEELSQKLRLAERYLELDEAGLAALRAEQKAHERRSRHLTPLLKWLASEKAVEIARRAVQIHGGAGYIRETGVEKLLRDAMVFPIYEGTSQIQALMAMKDNLLAAVRAPGRFAKETAATRWRALTSTRADERRVAGLRLQSQQAITHLVSRLAATKLGELRHHGVGSWSAVMKDWDPKRDFALAMLHAERLTALLTDAAVGEILLEQARRHPERRELLERFLERAEPRARAHLDRITTTGAGLLTRLAASEPDAAARLTAGAAHPDGGAPRPAAGAARPSPGPPAAASAAPSPTEARHA